MMSASPDQTNRNVERGRSTRARLLEVATKLFADRGFERTSVELVLERAGVSKGSLYHHFANKEELFEAVLDGVEASVADATVAAAAQKAEPIQALRAACRAWLRMAREPVVRQIVLLDAPAVLGWQRWREIDERHAFGLLKRGVDAILAARHREASSELTAHVLLASIIEIAMLIARSKTPKKALAAGDEALDQLFSAMFEG